MTAADARPVRPLRVFVELDAALDPRDWSARHARGEVPDRLPYGIDRLAGHGVEVEVRRPLTGRPVTRLARSVRGRSEGWEWVDALASHRDAARRRADAVVCWDERTGVPEALTRSRRDPPLLMGVTWLGDDPLPGRPLLAAARHALGSVALVWAHSTGHLPVLRSRLGVPENRLRLLPFGVDTDFFVPQGEVPAALLVASVGDDRHRDHELLVAACAAAQRTHPGLRLELGSRLPVRLPPELGVLHARRLGPAVRDLYARANVVAIATRPNAHGSGLSVVLEAGASGRPVVVSDNPGIREYVQPGRTGLLVPPGDADAFAKALSSLLADPERCAEMGRAAREWVHSRHSTAVQAGHLAELVREVVGAQAPPAAAEPASRALPTSS